MKIKISFKSPPAVVMGSFLMLGVLVSAPSARSQDVISGSKAKVGNGYDIVSIKEARTNDEKIAITPGVDDFRASGVSIRLLISTAYGLREDLVYGLPEWAKTEKFDVYAKITDADPKDLSKLSWDDRKRMLGIILTSRFHLKAHQAVKNLPVFDLVVGAKGPKLQTSAAAKDGGPPQSDVSIVSPGNLIVTSQSIMGNGVPLSTFASALTAVVNKNVIDKTGCTGLYDFNLRWTPDELGSSAGANLRADAPPPLFTALPQQLGLKLVRSEGPVQILEVDEVGKPDED